MNIQTTKAILDLILLGEFDIILASVLIGVPFIFYAFAKEATAEADFYNAETKYYNELLAKEQAKETKTDEQPQIV